MGESSEASADVGPALRSDDLAGDCNRSWISVAYLNKKKVFFSDSAVRGVCPGLPVLFLLACLAVPLTVKRVWA